MAKVRAVADELRSSEEPAIDGRRLRAERNRDAVVDAILDLLREGDEQPGAAEIAERAGVSLRSVFRHFDDLESLHAAAVERHTALIAPLFILDAPPARDGGVPAPVAERIAALVPQRALLYEEMHPVRRAGERNRSRSSAIRDGLERSRRILRRQLTDLFEAELAACPAAERRALADALEAASSYRMWTQCREDQKLSIARSEAAMARTLSALLSDAAR